MDVIWAMRGLLGGAFIGVSASVLLLMNGRVAGISGILGGLLGRASQGEHAWRALFVIGLLLGGAVSMALVPGAFSAAPPALGIAIAAGVLVGVGTKIGNGCTSGHGVCGISRFSVRSVIATLTFIGTGAISVLALRGAGVTP